MDPSKPVFGLSCTSCGCTLELPADLTAIYINCPSCGADNVLAPALIQARQRQYDLQLLQVERVRQVEQQRLVQLRILAHRRAATRRNTTVALVLVSLFLVLPALVLAGLFALGILFGKKTMNSLAEVQDPRKNGMPAMVSELRTKQSEGCGRVVLPPQIRMGGPGIIKLPLESDGPCVHLLGSTAAPGAALTIEQLSRRRLTAQLPSPAAAIDYRLCPSDNAVYEFALRSDASAPFTIAAVACPRTRAEGLVRSKLTDPDSTGASVLRSWVGEFYAKGCRAGDAEPSVVQGQQTLDVESSRGGPCFHLLVASHFDDSLLAVKLSSPSGKTIATPEPATRVHLEFCPSQTGRHEVEITPSTRDHYAMQTLDCPRRLRQTKVKSAPLLPR